MSSYYNRNRNDVKRTSCACSEGSIHVSPADAHTMLFFSRLAARSVKMRPDVIASVHANVRQSLACGCVKLAYDSHAELILTARHQLQSISSHDFSKSHQRSHRIEVVTKAQHRRRKYITIAPRIYKNVANVGRRHEGIPL